MAKRAQRPADPKPQAIFGRQPVREALRAGVPMVRLWLQAGLSGGSLSEIEALARSRRIVVQRVPPERLEELSGGGRHQGVAALVAAKPLLTLEQLQEALPGYSWPPFLLLLDGIQDSGNLGAVLRVAYAAGCQAVVLPAHRSAPLTPTAVRTSSGAVHYLDIVQVPNLARAVEKLQEWGLAVYAAVPTATRPYTAVDYTGPVALVIGSEAEGVRPLVQKRADGLVAIPMRGQVASLNAATAAAVLCFEVVRQRTTPR